MKFTRFILPLVLLCLVTAGPASAESAGLYNVPFATQAPFGKWSDPVFQDACEETSVIMAMSWIREEVLSTAQVATQIQAIAAWEKNRFGFHQDTSAQETATIISEYYGWPAETRYDIGTLEIIQALADRSIAIVPVNAQALYKYGGPARHMIVVVGYDQTADQFIIHDPSRKSGNLRIDNAVLAQSLRDYPSGIHRPVTETRTAMIQIHWPWLGDPR